MTENEALQKMIAPGQLRPSKPYRGGVIQILVTSSCDKACFGCTQGSQLRRKPWFMTPEQYGQALESLRGYFGVVGMFGGNPALHPQFKELCQVLRESWVPFEQRGIWSNNPLRIENAMEMRRTFNPRYSNLNVHLDEVAHRLFREGWPESQIVGLREDSRHSPPWVAMKDVVVKDCPRCGGKGNWFSTVLHRQEFCSDCGGSGTVPDESRIWELISNCDINQRWSAGIGVFRGELRAWFCEEAMAQAIAHQWDTNQVDPMPPCNCGADRTGPSAEAHKDNCPAKVSFVYPDTGTPIALTSEEAAGFTLAGPQLWKFKVDKDGVDMRPQWFADRIGGDYVHWWELPMFAFTPQVRKHCFDCGVPLRGYGELSQSNNGKEQVSKTHANIFHPKRKERMVEHVTQLHQLGIGRIQRSTDYIQNARK